MFFVGKITPVHEDNRRAIAECNGDGFSIQHFEVKERIPLGNNFHRGKFEVFTILRGGGVVITRPIGEDGNPIGAEEITELQPLSVVKIPPYTAHTFYLNPGTTMTCFSSAQFDEQNQDMTKFVLKP